MDSNQFSVIIQTVLEKSGITKEISEVQKIVNNNMVKIVPQLETASIKNNLKEVSKLIANTLNNSLGGDFKISGNDVFKALTVSMNEANVAAKKLASEMDRVSAMTKFQNYMSNNTKITKDAKNQLLEWIHTIESADDLTKDDIRNINTQFKTLDSQMRTTGKLGRSLKDSIASGIGSFATWVSATSIVMGAVNSLRKMSDAVFKVDTAMTNLYKVTDETSIKYNQFLDSANDKAQKLGRSVSSLVEQSANWAKLGFSIDDSAKLAEISSIYANVGEVDDDTAVSDIVTTMKAFNLETSDAITIVDSFNKLGNEFAVTAAGLGDGVSNAASAMALGGMTLEKTLALLTGGAEITQEAGELGNALKVGQMRVMGMKGALEELGEEYEDLESVSKIQTHILNLTQGQVDIMNEADPTKFKDYYDILEDVSEVYDKLDQTTQADLLETLFGKQRGNQGAAILQAFQSGQVQKALDATMASAGSAYAEQEKWMDSLEAKTKQFEAAFESLSQTILNSNFLKGIVDSGTGAINIIDSIIDKVGILTPLLSGIGAVLGAKGLGLTIYLSKFYKPIYIRFYNNAI
ncbi:phage tail tape measure protein [Kineothrix sedimenti]|uniref:Phage tail tape measure protein n=1 Tax=Kineothrix sedimenti TaxID=3123317 RepID=A0ABZ3EZU9_9FIRM